MKIMQSDVTRLHSVRDKHHDNRLETLQESQSLDNDMNVHYGQILGKCNFSENATVQDRASNLQPESLRLTMVLQAPCRLRTLEIIQPTSIIAKLFQ
jgi:hypothetical protein